MAALLSSRDPDQAARLRRQAQAIFADLVARAGSEALAAAIQATPAARQLHV